MEQQRIEEAEGMDASCDYNALNDRYVSACERHGTSPHDAITAAFCKVRCQHTKKEKQTLELLLDQIPETDMEPLIEMLSAIESSDLDAVDVVYSNSVSNLRWPLLVQVMRAAGSKLRMADLSDNVLGREAVRELFHGGINCQNMNLSFSHIRKMELSGHFPNLHTLKLDCIPVTCLPEGCFCSMPRLAKLSMCGTNIMNLWTTSAALRKLLALRELCFQKCLCCQGTGQCAAETACLQSDDVSWREGRLYQGGVDRIQRRGGEEYESLGSAPSDLSGSGDELEHLLTYSEPEDNQSSGNWIVEPAEDSDAEQVGPNVSQDMDGVRGDSPNHQSSIREICEDLDDPENVDTIADEERRSASEHLVMLYEEAIGGNYGRHALLDFVDLDDSSILPESMASIEGILSDASVGERGAEFETDDADISMLEAPERVVATRTNRNTREVAALIQEANRRSTFRLTDGSGEGASEPGPESSGEDGEEPCSIIIPKAHLEWGSPGARHAFMAVSPICDEKSYREFMITMLPALEVLDNMAITETEREKARCVFEEQFEPFANRRKVKESVLQVLKRRETGGSGVRAPCGSRLGYIDNERSPAAYIRSLSAAKMGTIAWPATKTICRVKNPSFDGGRRCRPRQFEYHPTEPSYMVFGTLQGEVVVINHESDKVVGYVQSIGAPHSILGLCWLNKDPNKLIAGSDNGSLQLYDVNHMRASMISANRRGVLSSVSNRYQLQGNENWGRQPVSGSGRSPTLYTYDDFEQLTSVHINSTDDYFVASGYSNHVGLYDLHTGTLLQVFSDLHKEHINVVKFANHSPQIFATSSFDKEIKMWDLRQKVTQPLYTVRSNRGNVMVCFSRDDHYLLSSAVDNEVRQYLAVDGRLHLKFDITPMSSSLNYTRSYYLNGRDYIISGSCEENVVRVCCAQTGRRLRDLTVEGRGFRNSLYVQSLRGDPFKDFHFCMLVAYNHPHSRSEIVKVNLLGGESQGEDHEFQPQQVPLTGLGA